MLVQRVASQLMYGNCLACDGFVVEQPTWSPIPPPKHTTSRFVDSSLPQAPIRLRSVFGAATKSNQGYERYKYENSPIWVWLKIKQERLRRILVHVSKASAREVLAKRYGGGSCFFGLHFLGRLQREAKRKAEAIVGVPSKKGMPMPFKIGVGKYRWPQMLTAAISGCAG